MGAGVRRILAGVAAIMAAGLLALSAAGFLIVSIGALMPADPSVQAAAIGAFGVVVAAIITTFMPFRRRG